MTKEEANYFYFYGDMDWDELNSYDIEVQKIAISRFHICYFKEPSLQLQKLYIEERLNNNFTINSVDELYFCDEALDYYRKIKMLT
jgi:hypothetical protein